MSDTIASLTLAEEKINQLETKVQKLEKAREVLAIDEVEKAHIIDVLTEIENQGQLDEQKIQDLTTSNAALTKENAKLKYRIQILLRELQKAEDAVAKPQ